jgi:tRNA dimethylallyltransferase
MTNEEFATECWYLTGATASGKTGVGVELALLMKAEIISLDSMAIYQGMDIGTAKPTPAEQDQVPHHLLDLIPPNEEFSVARYVEAAQQTVAEIRSRDRNVLFVGGTPLYLKSLLRGIFAGPEADWEFRRQVEDEVLQVGQQALYDRLRQIDPVTAARLHPNDTRRLIRALEVYKLTGQPISHLQMQFEEGRTSDECRVFVLERPLADLHQAIDQRVERMMHLGLVEEVESLLARGQTFGRTARQAVGYREVLDYLDGKCTLAQAAEQMNARTRRFAKRQRTWFRSLSECRSVPVRSDEAPDVVAAEIYRQGMG